MHLTVREDRSVVSLQNGLYQGRPADFIHPLLSRPVPEHGVEEEALGGFPRISSWVAHDDFSPVFLCLGNAVSSTRQRGKMCGHGKMGVSANVREESSSAYFVVVGFAYNSTVWCERR